MPKLYSHERNGLSIEHSDAQFESEQDIFSRSTPLLDEQGADHDFIDVASFLEMDHVPDCWCRPCQATYRLMDDGDDDWTICSSSAAGARSPSTCSAWESEWGTLVDDASDLVGR